MAVSFIGGGNNSLVPGEKHWSVVSHWQSNRVRIHDPFLIQSQLFDTAWATDFIWLAHPEKTADLLQVLLWRKPPTCCKTSWGENGRPAASPPGEITADLLQVLLWRTPPTCCKFSWGGNRRPAASPPGEKTADLLQVLLWRKPPTCCKSSCGENRRPAASPPGEWTLVLVIITLFRNCKSN